MCRFPFASKAAATAGANTTAEARLPPSAQLQRIPGSTRAPRIVARNVLCLTTAASRPGRGCTTRCRRSGLPPAVRVRGKYTRGPPASTPRADAETNYFRPPGGSLLRTRPRAISGKLRPGGTRSVHPNAPWRWQRARGRRKLVRRACTRPGCEKARPRSQERATLPASGAIPPRLRCVLDNKRWNDREVIHESIVEQNEAAGRI